VTGNLKHFPPGCRGPVTVMSPRAAWERFVALGVTRRQRTLFSSHGVPRGRQADPSMRSLDKDLLLAGAWAHAGGHNP
jgi:hypothetical protein